MAARLRAYAKDQGGWHNIDDTCEQAADLIDRQTAEIEALRAQLKQEQEDNSEIPTAELPALVERGFPASEYVREMSFRHTYTILPVVDYDAQTIELRTFHNGIQEHIHEVIRLKEAAVRSALIALGWTPPMGDA